MANFRSYTPYFCLGGAVLLFVWAVQTLKDHPPRRASDEMRVVLPVLSQVALFGGDRYLAANFTVYRALVTPDARSRADHLAVQAASQRDASWLNPAHEDNYYVAAAVLPWSGQVAASESILRAAVDARPYDMLPPFFYGFNRLYFLNDPVTAAQYMRIAAERAPLESQRAAMEKTAVRWFSRGDDPETARAYLQGMLTQARTHSLKAYLQLRLMRVQQLIDLRRAASEYEARFGHPISDIRELVRAGVLDHLPQDPLGLGFSLDARGRPILNQPVQQGQQK